MMMPLDKSQIEYGAATMVSVARIIFRISLKFVPKGPIDNKSALVHVMAWRRTGDKALPEPMLIKFTDAYMLH